MILLLLSRRAWNWFLNYLFYRNCFYYRIEGLCLEYPYTESKR